MISNCPSNYKNIRATNLKPSWEDGLSSKSGNNQSDFLKGK